MFFVLSKILAWLVAPLSWVFIACIIALIKAGKIRRRAIAIAFMLLFIFSNSFILEEVMRSWEWKAQPLSSISAAKYGIILGGFTYYDPNIDRVEFSSGTDRMLIGYQLYQQGLVRKLIITGGSSNLVDTNYREGDMVAKYLHAIGMAPNDLIVERNARNTHENAAYTKPLVSDTAGPVLLITSARHMRRAIACFEKAGIKAIPVAVDRHAGRRKWNIEHLLIPNADALAAWQSLIHEWLGYFFYWMAGYL